MYWHRCRFYLVGDTLQILPRIAILAAVVSAYPVEYEDLTHFGPAPVQYHQTAPLVKHLVVEKYVSLTCERFLLLGATKYIFQMGNLTSDHKNMYQISHTQHHLLSIYSWLRLNAVYNFSLYQRL
jgi:hypothetical protein